MSPPRSIRQRGSVVLATLCFVAVLAIAVTTYLSLSSRAMNLSGRTFHVGLSEQLAEIGVELGASALNNDTWTGWTTNGVAARTTHVPATNYGMGVAASVKIRITNRFASNWRSAATYGAGHLAWYRGQWYQSRNAVSPSTAPPPDVPVNWASVPGAWTVTTAYAPGDIVTHNGIAYRCLLAHLGKAPPEPVYWVTTGTGAWTSAASYAVNDTVIHGGTLYKCLVAHSNQTPATATATNTTYWAGAPVIYVEGRANPPDNAPARLTQLRAEFTPAPLFPNAVGATNPTTSVNFASSGTLESYNSNTLQHVLWSGSTSYIMGDTVYYAADGGHYRALVAHSNQAPVVAGEINSAYWTPAVTAYRNWDSAVGYKVGDIIGYSGNLYRCLAEHTNRTPPNDSFWVQQMEFVPWSSSTTYSLNDLVANAAGTVYRSRQNGNTNRALTNTTYWEIHNLATHATVWTSGTAYSVGDLVSNTGLYYRCISNHNSNNGNRTTSNYSLWAMELIGYPKWTSGVAYAVGNVVFYRPPDIGGRASSVMLYRCRSATSANAPTNATNWEVGSVDYSTWTSTTGYRVGDIAFYPVTGLFYRARQAHTNQAPASATATNTTYWEHTGRYFSPWTNGYSYRIGDIAFNASDGKTYRCIRNHSNSAPPNATNWAEIGTDFPTWSNTAAYAVGDIVYRTSNNTVYRCIRAHTGQSPPNTTYWSITMFGHSAVVAAPAVTSPSTTVIRGYVNATTTSFGSNAIVQGPTSPATPRVDASRVSTSFHVPQFEPPASYAALSGPGTNLPASEGDGSRLYEGARTLGTPGATTPSVYNITATYINDSSSSNTSGLYLDDSTDVLTIIGPVILNVSGMLYTNTGRIVVAPTGSLEIFFNGSQLYIGNSTANTGGGIINQTFDPAKMLLASASTYNSSSYHYYWSRLPFHGLIYMPNAYLHKWNSGFNGELYGAISAKTVYFNHPAFLDYDMAQRTIGSTGSYLGAAGTFIERPFTITSWRELADPADRVSF